MAGVPGRVVGADGAVDLAVHLGGLLEVDWEFSTVWRRSS